MNIKRFFVLITVWLFAFTIFSPVFTKDTRVRDHETPVKPHDMSSPDGNFISNWSIKGHVNLYTREEGTRATPSYKSNYGSNYNASNANKNVRDNRYFQKKGTYIKSNYRLKPDGNFNNNLSPKGSVNPNKKAPSRKLDTVDTNYEEDDEDYFGDSDRLREYKSN